MVPNHATGEETKQINEKNMANWMNFYKGKVEIPFTSSTQVKTYLTQLDCVACFDIFSLNLNKTD